jgi:galactose-1-phosphate uridylyltransferase
VTQKLERPQLAEILQAENVADLSFEDLAHLFRTEPGVAPYRPTGSHTTDPRNGERVLFHPARARRPHDNRPVPPSSPEQICLVCQGKTTGVVDVADLSEGFTFINKNLYPIVFPLNSRREEAEPDEAPGSAARGLHFLQWTSSHHERDWHNLPRADRLVALNRLAALEGALLGHAPALSARSGARGPSQGFVSIIKNCGRLVGGSLTHGHQQIALTNLAPRRVEENRRFEVEQGEPFIAHLMRENPKALLVRDYGPAVLMVPYFMRRPYDMILAVRETDRRYLHELTPKEREAVAEGWGDALQAIHTLMPALGRELAYNVLTHNGSGAGLYFEFLPFTQENGGFERLGLSVCQASPAEAAGQIRSLL